MSKSPRPPEKKTPKGKGTSRTKKPRVLIPLALVVLAAVLVAAYGAYNGTGNFSFSGDFAASDMLLPPEPPETPAMTFETASPIEVFADTQIELEYDDTSGTLTAQLLLDDGSPLEGQILSFIADGQTIASIETDVSGEITIFFQTDNATHELAASFGGNKSEYLNPSEATLTIGAFAVPENITTNVTINATPSVGWATYDPQTDTITIVGDGVMCTQGNPCNLSEIHAADSAAGWGQVEGIYNYFIVNANIIIGDGTNETHFTSTFEQIYTTKPWSIRANAAAVFGKIDESEIVYGGIVFETNVSADEQLENEASMFAESGSRLEFYDSVYKVYSAASNNIYTAENSRLIAVRFDIQNIYQKLREEKTKHEQAPFRDSKLFRSTASPVSQSNPSTTFFIQKSAVISDYLAREQIALVCRVDGQCEEIGVANQ